MRSPSSAIRSAARKISITEGVVSRIEVQRYSHSQRHLLAVTVDAAINAGNSGGPVFGEGKVIGIAFQKLTGVDNIGEMVPPPIIKSFLEGVAKGKRPEIPALGITTQNLENPLLRKQLGLSGDEKGVVVLHVDHQGSSDGVLQPRDVITSIDNLKIANNGTVQFLGRHRTRYDVVLGNRYIGDRITLEIKRDGKPKTVEIELREVDAARAARALRPAAAVLSLRWPRVPAADARLPDDLGQVVEQGAQGVPQLLLPRLSHRRAARGRDPTQVLADEINVGYAHLYNEAVATLDGRAPLDMEDFVAQLSAARGVVEIVTTSGGMIMLDAEEVRKATSRILARYHIPRDRTPGLPGAQPPAVAA